MMMDVNSQICGYEREREREGDRHTITKAESGVGKLRASLLGLLLLLVDVLDGAVPETAAAAAAAAALALARSLASCRRRSDGSTPTQQPIWARVKVPNISPRPHNISNTETLLASRSETNSARRTDRTHDSIARHRRRESIRFSSSSTAAASVVVPQTTTQQTRTA